MNNLSDTYLIRKFLRKSLSKDEALIFASRKENPEFLEKLENEIITIKNRGLLKERLQKISEQSPVISKQRPKFIYMAIAASITLLISFQLFNNYNSSNQDIYDSFYYTYPNVYNQKGIEEPSLSDFNKAMSFYDSKDYSSAKSTFEDISKDNTLKDNELFYYGITLMEVNLHHQSEEQFRLITNIHTPFYIEAQWYLALTLVKRNKNQEAKTILKSLLKSSSLGQKRKNEIADILNTI